MINVENYKEELKGLCCVEISGESCANCLTLMQKQANARAATVQQSANTVILLSLQTPIGKSPLLASFLTNNVLIFLGTKQQVSGL